MVNISFGDFSNLGLIYCNIGVIFEAKEIAIFQTEFDLEIKQKFARDQFVSIEKTGCKFDDKMQNDVL